MMSVLLANLIEAQGRPISFEDLHYRAYKSGLIGSPIDLANRLEELDLHGVLSSDEESNYSIRKGER